MMMQGILKAIGCKKSPPQMNPTAGNLGAGASFFADFMSNPQLRASGVSQYILELQLLQSPIRI